MAKMSANEIDFMIDGMIDTINDIQDQGDMRRYSSVDNDLEEALGYLQQAQNKIQEINSRQS